MAIIKRYLITLCSIYILFSTANGQDSNCPCIDNYLNCFPILDPVHRALANFTNRIILNPKSCPYVGNGIVTSTEKKFCLNFAADYYYRLRFTEEDLTYKGNNNSQKMHRDKLSSTGALFMLAQVVMESGWGVGSGYATHNYWGLGGAYTKSNGKTTFMSFASFDDSFAFLFNHFERGISPDGTDSSRHPGWPDFLQTLKKENITEADFNRSLNSGKWCKGHPAYNVDPDTSCTAKNGCPCIDYAHFVIRHALSGITRQCIPIWKKALEDNTMTETSIVYGKPQVNLPSKKERITKTLQDVSNYLQIRCLDFIKKGP